MKDEASLGCYIKALSFDNKIHQAKSSLFMVTESTKVSVLLQAQQINSASVIMGDTDTTLIKLQKWMQSNYLFWRLM